MITTAITNDRFTWCLRVERKFTIFALFSDSKQVILAGTASLIPIVIPLLELRWSILLSHAMSDYC